MKTISPVELKAMMDSGNEFQLIDIRDDYEYNICCIGGEKINMYSIPDNIDKISRNNKVIIYCRTGSRSGNIVKFLEESFSFDNVYNLDGGIMKWKNDVDSSLVFSPCNSIFFVNHSSYISAIAGSGRAIL